MNPIQMVKALRAWGRLKRLTQEYAMTKEPVMIAEIVKAAAVLLAVFGFELTAEQVGSIVVVVGLVAGIFIRSRVSPV